MTLYEIFDGDGTWWVAASDPGRAGKLVSEAMASSGYEAEDVSLAMSGDLETKSLTQDEAVVIPFHGSHGDMWTALEADIASGKTPCVVACSEWE